MDGEPSPSKDDEDEWEYEYDEEETETMYITLDLSSRAPGSVAFKNANTSTSTAISRQRQARNAGYRPLDEPASATDKQGPNQIQILDLASPTPLVSYDSQLYVCHWATDIGTTLHIAPSGASDPHPPLRALPRADVLAKTRARLVAVPARLKPTTAPTPAVPPAADGASGQPDWEITTPEGDHVASTGGKMTISVPATSSTAKQAQARFLSRWTELRSRRGMTDAVPIKPLRAHALPEGWEEERARWLAMDGGKGALGVRRRRRAPQQGPAAGEGIGWGRRVRFRDEDGDGTRGGASLPGNGGGQSERNTRAEEPGAATQHDKT